MLLRKRGGPSSATRLRYTPRSRPQGLQRIVFLVAVGFAFNDLSAHAKGRASALCPVQTATPRIPSFGEGERLRVDRVPQSLGLQCLMWNGK